MVRDVGILYYGGSAMPIVIDDRMLAHLKIVITTKLRRGESFPVSWRHAADQEPGRSTIWLHPSIPLRFVFDEPEPPELDRKWMEELAQSANTSRGVRLDDGQAAERPTDEVSTDELSKDDVSTDAAHGAA